MNVIGVIPARYGSTRFPGKPLKKILGKPLLQWVLERAKSSEKLSSLLVATDHEDIKNLAEACGVEAVMTDSELPSGSDRVWAATEDRNVDVILNIQGDEPLITGQLLDQLVVPFEEHSNLDMATLGRSITYETLKSKNTAKIVLNENSEALYFSRFPIPFSRNDAELEGPACLKHIGIYAYNKGFLKRFCECPPVPMEKAEGLEQLRALYLGARIKVVQVEHESWGVDTPEDIQKIEDLLQAGENHGS